jgi:hypothetical protein
LKIDFTKAGLVTGPTTQLQSVFLFQQGTPGWSKFPKKSMQSDDSLMKTFLGMPLEQTSTLIKANKSEVPIEKKFRLA